MEPRRTARFRVNKKAQDYLVSFLVVAAGVFFLRTVFNTFLQDTSIGTAQVPSRDLDGKVHIYDMNGLKSTPDLSKNTENVLILTPLAKFYPGYWQNVLKLSYPHKHIELGFIVPNNDVGDAALAALSQAIKQVQTSTDPALPFKKIHLLRQDTPSPDSQKEADRHAFEFQKERRKMQSLARNSLLFTTLGHETAWVLWLDGDIVETPPTLIQDLAKHDKDVIVANCWQRYTEKGEQKSRPYDFNSWVDSDRAREIGETLGNDDILLEGYAQMATYRTLMAHLYDEKASKDALLELDGVGATALLVKADVHRDGAMFPPFAFYHLIESEGFAKMAKRLAYKVYGLPNYLVYHYNE